MNHKSSSWETLRDCCKDEAAFVRLKQVLGTLPECQPEYAERSRLSEEKFARAFCSSPASVNITTFTDGRFLEVNDAFVEVTGYSRDEAVGRTATELGIWVHPEDAQQMRELLRSQGEVRNMEYEFRQKSGEIAIGLVSAEIVEFDGQLCILGMTNDITERKQTESYLKTALERDRLLGEMALRIRRSLKLEQILQSTVIEVRQFLQADRVFIACADGNNCGKVRAESVGSDWEPILGRLGCVPDPKALAEIQQVFEQNHALVIDDVSAGAMSPLRCEMIEQLHVKAVLGVPIWLGDRLMGALVVHQCTAARHWRKFEIDLLEKLATQVAIAMQQAQLYEQVQALNTNLEQQVQDRTIELQQKLEELEKLSELKDFFLHAVSHDLRTPIMGMLMVLKNLLSKSDNSQKIEVSGMLIDRMIQNSDRQLDMLNLLLDSEALETGVQTLHFQSSQMHTLIADVIVDMQPLLDRKQAHLTDFICPNLPPISIDLVQMRRVFENLIGNSLNHNPPGLGLTIEAKVEANQLYCTIEDDGVGIENCEYLFARYARGKHVKYSTGIGLGLYLCKQIVLAHGGEIGMIDRHANRSGKGSTFWLRLPLAQSALQA